MSGENLNHAQLGRAINLVTWHELALGPVAIRGQVPEVYTSLPELLEFTRTNLDTFWRDLAAEVAAGGAPATGGQDKAIAWIVLGAARLHHLLSQHTLTSKSGAGRYVIKHLTNAGPPSPARRFASVSVRTFRACTPTLWPAARTPTTCLSG